MQNVLFSTIRQRRQQLQQASFIKFLANETADPEARLSYVPHMLFFIMGFKDMLQCLKREGAIDPIQQDVNEHCDEDNGHWKWFLADLKAIRLKDNFYDQDKTKLFSELYSDENYVIRDMVYDAMHYCKLANTSANRMIILEVIEAIFSVFVENMNVLVFQLGKYDEYKFFGRVHHEAESGHSNGSWLDGGKKEIHVEAGMSEGEKELALTIINGLFDGFEAMANRWNVQQKQYLRKNAPVLL